MDIVYYEYYPHDMGTMIARVVLPLEVLLLGREVAKDCNKNPDLVDLLPDLEDSKDEAVKEKSCYFFYEAMRDSWTVNLERKGWHHGLAEEGSFFWALPEFEDVALKALKKYEAKVFLEGEFDDDGY